jgi:hypothetical protein
MDNVQSAIKADKIIGGLGLALMLTLVLFTYQEDLVGAGIESKSVKIICNKIETTEFCCSEETCKTHIPCDDLPENCKGKV